MSAFKNLKKNAASNTDKLRQSVAKLSNKPGADERFWYPDVDKAGNSTSTIRFLAPVEGEDIGYVRLFNHGFKGPFGWYIENSLTTLGKPDPMSEYNSELWNSVPGNDKDHPVRKQVSRQKRNQVFISNILVVKDTLHPEHEGKVKLFKFGKKIFDKVMAGLDAEGTDEDPIIDGFNMFDEGANFVIKVRTVDGNRNYDNSLFAKQGPLAKTDAEIEEIWKQALPLQQFLAPDQFKSYDDLKARMLKVFGLDKNEPATPAPVAQPKAAPVRQAAKPAAAGDTSNDGEDEAFFANIVKKGLTEA